MAKGTIYNYYKDKQDLFISLAKHGYEHFEEIMSEAKVQHTNLADFLHYLIRKALQGVSEHVDLAHMLQSAASQLPEELRSQIMAIWHEHVTLATSMMADSLAEVAETRNLSPEERMAGAKLIAGAFLYLTHISCICMTDAASIDKDVDDFVQLISRALTMEHAS
jgi:AcrR family transcriptional regulator